MTISLTYSELKSLAPCQGRLREAAKLMGGARKWGKKRITAKEAVEAGVGFDDLLWVASAVALNDKGVERRLRLFVADCAARALPIFEKQYPSDARPREAIIAARKFANNEIGDAAGAAGDAAWAAGDAAWAAGDAAWAAEKQWQLERLVLWLSDPEPTPIDLPGLPGKEG